MGRRDEVVEAAIRVTAAAGVRGLTHRAVDDEGGLPRGTASNHFRSKHELTVGTLERLSEQMADLIGHVDTIPVADIDDVATVLGTNLAISLQTRVLAAASSAFFHEAIADPTLRDALVATNRRWWQAIARMLRDAGLTDDVDRRAQCLLSYGNGLVVDQLALRDPDFDALAAMRLGVRGFCSP